MTSFTMDCYQNEYLPAGTGEMHAILTVTAAGGAPTSAPSSGSTGAFRGCGHRSTSPAALR